MFQVYGKSAVAFIVAVLTAVSSEIAGHQHLGPVEKVQLAIAVTSAVGVWLVPMAPQLKWSKTAVAALLAALNLAASLLSTGHGLSTADWINLAIAALGVVGVHVAPAQSGVKLVPAAPPAADKAA